MESEVQKRMRHLMREVERYMAMPYPILLTPDKDEQGNEGWVAEFPDLPGCISQGFSPDNAVARLREAMVAWLAVALTDGREIPLPTEPA